MTDDNLPPPLPPEAPTPIPPGGPILGVFGDSSAEPPRGGPQASAVGPPPGGGSAPPGGPPGWGPADDSPPGNPWERRRTVGFFRGFFETIGLFIRSPKAAFAVTRRKGDLWSPFLFAILVAWPAFIVDQTWTLVFKSSYLALVPEEFQDRLGITSLEDLGGTVIGLVVGVFALPFLVALGILIGGAIFHFFLMMLGALDKSDAGFEGSCRVVAFAAVADIAVMVPFCGSAVAGLWGLVLQIIGLSVIHRTSIGKSAVAVIAPAVLCCACVILGIAMLVALGINLAS